MESNLQNSASDFLYHTHFYFNILSLAAKISARWLHCHKHGTCYSIVCSPLILIGAHFSSLAINQLHDLSLFKKMMKKRPCSEINAFKNSDPVFIDGVTFLNIIIVFDWPAMFSGLGRTEENLAAQRISRRRTVGWIVKKYRSMSLLYVVQSGDNDKK